MKAGRVLAGLLAASLALAAGLGGCALGGSQAVHSPESPAPTLPGTPATPATPGTPGTPGSPGHFDNGEFSFDYPTDWPLLASGVDSGGVEYVIAVMGDGAWQDGCVLAGNTLSCGGDKLDVAPGGIVVKVYRWWGGPLVLCTGDTRADATFGSLAVRERVDGSMTSWEVRVPGNEFGQNNNIFIEVHTTDAGQLARAKAMVASFRWLGASGAIGCGQSDPP